RYIRADARVAARNSCNYKEIQWWRRGKSEYSHVLKTRNLLIFQDAQNALDSENAPNWNVSGTRTKLGKATRTAAISTIVRHYAVHRGLPGITSGFPTNHEQILFSS